MTQPKTITVYCGSRPGKRKEYAQFAAEFGSRLGREGYAMLFGGGRLGLMGITADAALAAGAMVTGIIPEVFVDKEQAHTGVSHLEVVKDMNVRKKKLIQLGDAYVILPGGFGTLEEFADTADWIHIYQQSNRPVIVANICGLYDPLKTLIRTYMEEGFMDRDEWSNLHFWGYRTFCVFFNANGASVYRASLAFIFFEMIFEGGQKVL